jgi:nucleoside-diphosphate-sugar epimerase
MTASMPTPDCPPATFFVTGATGFVGGRLVAELLRRGHAVRALVRGGSDRGGLDASGLRLVEGDLDSSEALREGMAGCDGVFHLAACAKVWSRDKSVFSRVNVAGTRAVLDAASATGVPRVVVTSTIVTLGPTPPGVVGDEATPRFTEHFFTEYEATKTRAERETLEAAGRGLPVVVVNPTRVYGPGRRTEGNSVTRMVDLYDRGRLPFLLGGGRGVGNWVLVDDLVAGHIAAMERGRLGERYILGGENASQRDFLRLVDQVSGRRHLAINLPRALALAYASLEEKKADWFSSAPLITPGWVDTFLLDWAFSTAKAERELGYRPTPLGAGLELTYRWLLDERRAGRW